ncbi:unnamed protein product [Prunus armeniaca]|nr:unnamed protein product [Prunus armeniaca]
MWTLEKGCEDIIREAWDSTDAMGGVKEGIKNCAGKLAKWNKLTFGHVQKQLAAAHKELEVLQGRMGQDQVLLKKKVERTIVVLLEKEEVMWRQRSRVAWLKEGDKNTRFFTKEPTQGNGKIQ